MCCMLIQRGSAFRTKKQRKTYQIDRIYGFSVFVGESDSQKAKKEGILEVQPGIEPGISEECIKI